MMSKMEMESTERERCLTFLETSMNWAFLYAATESAKSLLDH